MADKSWKAFERSLAKAVGTERIPVSGREGDCDFEDGAFRYQAKRRGRAISKQLSDWLDATRTRATAHGKTGVLVVHRARRSVGDAVVLLSFKDWCDWHGPNGRVA